MGRLHCRSRQAMRAGELYYNVVIKHHYAMHMSCEWFNCRASNTYGEESLVGVGARVYGACVGGEYEDSIQLTVLSRYLTALQLSFASYAL